VRRAAIVLLVALTACPYWGEPRAADTAPASWPPAVSAETRAGARPADGPSQAALKERLDNLDRLHRDGVITDQEYRRRRQEALDAAFD
jgi:hypothetical protein